MTTFLHTSDWQLGMTRHYLSPRQDDDPQARFTADRIETIRRMGDVVREHDCSFVVVAGDVFETQNVSSMVIARACEAMASLRVPVHLLPGNHDSLEPGCIWDDEEFLRHCPDNVQVLRDSSPIRVTDGSGQVLAEIVAAPLTTRHPTTDPLAEVVAGLGPTDVPRVLVGHGQLAGLSGDTREALIDPEPLDRAVRDGLLRYVALGDRHIAWPPDDPHAAVRYSGTHETTGFREPGRGTAVVVDLGEPVCATTVEVGTWLHARVSRSMAGGDDLDALAEELDSFDRRDRTIVRYDLHGQLTVPQKARLDDLLAERESAFASLEPSEHRNDLTVVGNDADLDEVDLPSWVRDAAAELSARCATDEDATNALTLLHRLIVHERHRGPGSSRAGKVGDGETAAPPEPVPEASPTAEQTMPESATIGEETLL